MRPRHLDQRAHQLALVLVATATPRARPAAIARHGEHRELAGEGLGRGDADLRPGQRRHHDVALARDGRGRHVDDRQRRAASAPWRSAAPPACRRSRPTARRTIARSPGVERRLAVAEFGGDIDLDRQPREALEPVFRRPARHSRRCRRPRSTRARSCAKSNGSLTGSATLLGRHVEIVRERVADHLGLLVDFLRHEMAVVALVDQERRGVRLQHRRARPSLPAASRISTPLARQHRPSRRPRDR